MTRALLLCTASLFGTGCVSRTAPLFVDDGWSVEAWRDLGGGPAAAAIPAGTSWAWTQTPVVLAIDSQAHPIVAYDNPTSAAAVRRWDGVRWQDLGSPPSAGGFPALALDAQDRPCLATSYGNALSAARWESGAWQALPSIADPGGQLTLGMYPSLLVDDDGRLVTAVGTTTNDRTCVYRLEAGIWQLLAAPIFPPCFGSDDQRPGLALGTDGSLLMTLGSTRVLLWQWEAGGWTSLPAVDEGDTQGDLRDEWPAVIATPDGPMVAWVHQLMLTSYAVSARRWDGSTWVELDGSNSGAGLGIGSVVSGVALAASPSGQPIVVWSDGYTLYLRYWTGSVWREVFGSATVGIHSGIVSSRPAVAVRGDQVCVAFAAGSETEFDVFVRCATPSW